MGAHDQGPGRSPAAAMADDGDRFCLGRVAGAGQHRADFMASGRRPRRPRPARIAPPAQDAWALPGELNQYASLEDIDRAHDAQAAPAPSAPVLDFDRPNAPSDDGTRPAPSPGRQGSPSASSGLDFDLGFDQHSASSMGATLVAG